MSDSTDLGTRFVAAHSGPELSRARELFREYAESLHFSLDYQGFEEELAGLPGRYAPPGGCILLAVSGGDAAGCIAMRPLRGDVCELKRLYVRPNRRGEGIGRALCERLIEKATDGGYREMWLDSDPSFAAAISLYRALGFRPIARYNEDPHPETVYLGLRLR